MPNNMLSPAAVFFGGFHPEERFSNDCLGSLKLLGETLEWLEEILK